MPFPRVIQLRRVPLQHWPLRYHVVLATLLLITCASTGWWVLYNTSSRLVSLQNDHVALQQQLHDMQGRKQEVAKPDFTQSLPNAAHADEVARDIGRFAQSAGVQISSMTIDARPAGVTELGKVHFNVVAQAPYKSSKDWLAELLNRYPTLGVQALAMQSLPNDAIRQDIRVTFVWFVRE
jgi:hypothetical protein